MNRKTFLASLAGLFVLPKVLKSESKFPLISNKDFVLPMKCMENSYSLQYAKAIYQEWQKHEEQGELIVKDGYLIINQWDRKSVCVGDHLLTNKTDSIRVMDAYEIGADGRFGWRILWQYKCQLITPPKRICGRQVIRIDGKWRQYKQRDQFEFYKIGFTRFGSPFIEGTVRTEVGSDLDKFLSNHPKNNTIFKGGVSNG
jgi:hypothetical protein